MEGIRLILDQIKKTVNQNMKLQYKLLKMHLTSQNIDTKEVVKNITDKQNLLDQLIQQFIDNQNQLEKYICDIWEDHQDNQTQQQEIQRQIRRIESIEQELNLKNEQNIKLYTINQQLLKEIEQQNINQKQEIENVKRHYGHHYVEIDKYNSISQSYQDNLDRMNNEFDGIRVLNQKLEKEKEELEREKEELLKAVRKGEHENQSLKNRVDDQCSVIRQLKNENLGLKDNIVDGKFKEQIQEQIDGMRNKLIYYEERLDQKQLEVEKLKRQLKIADINRNIEEDYQMLKEMQ